METQEITWTKINCVECSKLFSCIRYLKTHMKLIHAKSESNTIDCKDCEEKFTSESDLKIHQYIVHPFLKFACEKCDKRFISKHSFNLHQQVLQLNQDEKQNSSETNIILVKQELRDHSPNRYNSEGHSMMEENSIVLNAQNVSRKSIIWKDIFHQSITYITTQRVRVSLFSTTNH